MKDKKQGMNLPNKLTVLRIILVPVFIVIMMLPQSVLDWKWSALIGAAIFTIASLTDMLDGKIARKYNLVTDFGKLMDPLADKFMVIGALTAIVYRVIYSKLLLTLFAIALLVVIFRELAVTSLRLVASSSSGVVVAANMLGKIKTVTQIVCVVAALVEPVIYATPDVASALPTWVLQYPPLTLTSCALMIVFTVWSGINYFIGMWKYLEPQK